MQPSLQKVTAALVTGEGPHRYIADAARLGFFADGGPGEIPDTLETNLGNGRRLRFTGWDAGTTAIYKQPHWPQLAAPITLRVLNATYAAHVEHSPPFTDSAFLAVQSGIRYVWQMIGHDSLSAAEQAGEELDNEAAIEGCIDADRLAGYGHQQAQRLIDAAVMKFGYSKVMEELKNRITLV